MLSGKNRVILSFMSLGENVSLARMMVAALAAQADLTIADLDEIKVAVSEAVSNAIIHGYQNDPSRIVEVAAELSPNELHIEVKDDGIGIENIELAMQPNYSESEERMGLGFSFMQSFMDSVEVISAPGKGTRVILVKLFSTPAEEE